MLGEVGSALGAKKVNIVAFMATVADSHGTVRMVVDKPAAARKVFAAHAWETTEEEVLEVALPDTPGSLAGSPTGCARPASTFNMRTLVRRGVHGGSTPILASQI